LSWKLAKTKFFMEKERIINSTGPVQPDIECKILVSLRSLLCLSYCHCNEMVLALDEHAQEAAL
jgi:hypothetical protein